MFVLIWATLLFSVRVSDTATGSAWGRTSCQGSYCITVEEEITAEVGLCVVIPCFFTTGYGFYPSAIVWFKCEPTKERCTDDDRIFKSKVSSSKIQLLESDVSQGNCSILINDLNESDSGSYQLRVNGIFNGRSDRFTYHLRAMVSIKALSQRPTVTVPPLTEGRLTTLTCTAPGLCSGSEPNITWSWRGRGESITTSMTESVSAFAKRSISYLTFIPSAEHHHSNVTCTVSVTGSVITEETATLRVTYMKVVYITQSTSVKEGESLNLTCSVESFPPALITWTKVSDQNVNNGTNTTVQNNTSSVLVSDTEERRTATLSISDVTAEDSGQYICTVTHGTNTWRESVNVTVIYMRDPVITGDSTVKLGDELILTCSMDSFPLAPIVWTKRGFSTTLHSGGVLQTGSGSSTLTIHNVTLEDSGHYICTATHLTTTATTSADVAVTWFSKIQTNSGCEVQLGVLTCMCISQGYPLPVMKWPLLEDHAAYSVITTVSNHTVNSTVILRGWRRGSVECVSGNEIGEAKEKLTIRINSSQRDQPNTFSQSLSWLQVILGFFLGALLTAAALLLVKRCKREKQKSHECLDETLEMVTNPEICNGQAAKDVQAPGRERAESVAANSRAPDLDDGPNDVEYASIDYSLLKRRTGRDGANKPESTETEYAEIKPRVKEERDDDAAEC